MVKRITIKDVAKLAGVTHTTVSRVIHDDERISEATRLRVQEAMRSSGYEPNLIARGLVQKKTQVIALITPDLDPHTLPIVRSVSESCTEHKYATMLFPMNTWLQERSSFEWVSMNWMVDGILVYNLIYHEHIPTEILRLRDGTLPFVFINKFIHESTLNAVGVDNYQSVGLVVDHLVGLGHTRIGLLYGDDSSVDGMERHGAFLAHMERLSLPVSDAHTGCGMWRDADAYEVTRQIMDREDPPTAIFSCNDQMAIGALRAFQDMGLRVPEDIAIAGFDNLESVRYLPIPLTTVKPPMYDVGETAFELLTRIIKEPDRAPEQIKLESELIVRGSTVKG